VNRWRSFGKRLDGIFGRRTAERAEVSIPVSLFTVDQSRVVILGDLSGTGARLEGHDLPPRGRDVWLKLAGADVFGRVVWSKPGQCGITFEDRLDGEELARILRELEFEPPRSSNMRRFYELR